jgi:hypothetical protein
MLLTAYAAALWVFSIACWRKKVGIALIAAVAIVALMIVEQFLGEPDLDWIDWYERWSAGSVISSPDQMMAVRGHGS